MQIRMTFTYFNIISIISDTIKIIIIINISSTVDIAFKRHTSTVMSLIFKPTAQVPNYFNSIKHCRLKRRHLGPNVHVTDPDDENMWAFAGRDEQGYPVDLQTMA